MANFIRYFKIFGVTENTSSGTFILASCTYFLACIIDRKHAGIIDRKRLSNFVPFSRHLSSFLILAEK